MRVSWITNLFACITLLTLVELIWEILRFNLTPDCSIGSSSDAECYRSCLASNPELQLAVFTSNNTFPDGAEVTKVLHVRNFDYNSPYTEESTVKIQGNTTLYLHTVLASMDIVHELEHFNWIRRPWFGNLIEVHTIQITGPKPHRITPYNLLWGQAIKSITEPGELVPHYLSKIYMVGLTGNITLSATELHKGFKKIHLANYRPFEDLLVLPIIESDNSKIQTEDLIEIIGNNTSEVKFEFNWEPITLGELRMMLRSANSSNSMLFFSEELASEFKKIHFEGSHNVQLYLIVLLFTSAYLSTTLLNIYLSRNDKKVPREAEIAANLFDAVKLIIFCLYFVDVPIQIYAVCYAILLMHPITHLREHRNSLKLWICDRKADRTIQDSEQHEAQIIKRKTMNFLVNYLVIPLSLSMATYSLIYHTHKGWYSWLLESWANGFYASEFVSRLCDLYANYKTKTIEPQSWHLMAANSLRRIMSVLLAVILRAPMSFTIFCICDNLITVFAVFQRYLYRSDESRDDSKTNVDQNCGASETIESCADSETNIDENSEYEVIENKKEL